MRIAVTICVGLGFGCTSELVDPDLPAGSEEAQKGDQPDPTQRLLPLTVGAEWVYSWVVGDVGTLNDPSPPSVRRYSIQGAEELKPPDQANKAPVVALRLVDDVWHTPQQTGQPNDTLVFFLEGVGDAIFLHALKRYERDRIVLESHYAPYRVYLDEGWSRWDEAEHESTRIRWSDAYPSGWTVTPETVTGWIESGDERVTVEAGTFSTVRVRRIIETLSPSALVDDATLWFAPGVGLVKRRTEIWSEGYLRSSETMTLRSYRLP
jgi:hypothetical protein